MSSVESSVSGEVVNGLMYFFCKVLPSSQREGDWLIDSIEQGLGWALYCEKAAQDPGVRTSIITYLDSKPFDELYTIEDVQRSRALLISNLFINQLVSEDVSQALVEISSRELGIEETLSLLRASAERVSHYRAAVAALRSKPFENSFINFKVRLLIESVATLSIPHEALNCLLKRDGSLGLLLDLSHSLSQQEKNQLMNCVGHWMSKELEKENHSLFNQIASLSGEQINYICDTFSGLEIKLLELIHTWGNSLSSRDVKECSTNPVFISLLRICRAYFQSYHLRSVAKAAFSTWFLSSEAHFWHYLFVEAQTP